MGSIKSKDYKGARKKVANIGEFIRQMIFNGEIPPMPKTESEKDFFISRGIAILNDEFEIAIFNTFLKCLKDSENGVLSLNFDLIKEYAKIYEFEFIDLCDILGAILPVANNALMQKHRKSE